MTPGVSIVVPVFNVAPYLCGCLGSLCRQTLRDIEIICVDDASSDGSSGLLQSAAAMDSRVVILKHADNRGLAAARNTGLRAVRGPWVLFVDSDDVASSYLCEHALNAAAGHGADAVFFNFLAFRDGDPEPRDLAATVPVAADRTALLQRPAFAWAKLVRTDLMRTRGMEFPEGLFFEDIPVHWRLAIESTRPLFLDEPLVSYRQRGGSITSRTDWRFADGILIYDLVRDYLVSTSRWEEWKDVFLAQQLANFAHAHAYFALANPTLTQRVCDEARARMDPECWRFVLSGTGLSRWKRDYLLSRCRPIGVRASPALVLSTLRHRLREFLRRARHHVRRFRTA